MRYLLEVAVAGVEDAIGACQAGADRLELNAALELGGLTPSPSLVEQIRREVPLPLIAMIRPRAGSFCYSETDQQQMRADVDRLLSAGADGCALGLLRPDRTIDQDALVRFRDQMQDRTLVFHRAFDATPDRSAALNCLIELRVDRVLTSGGAATALAGKSALRELVQQSRGRIEVLPGAGIRPENALGLLRETGAGQVHGTFRRWVDDAAPPAAETGYPRVDTDVVRQMRQILDRAAQDGA